MPVTRLNHAVLYVRDVQVTRDFYETVLGFRTLIWVPGRAVSFAGGFQHARRAENTSRIVSRSCAT